MSLFRGSKNATIVNGEIVATQGDIVEALNQVNIIATNIEGENTIGIVASIDDKIVTLADISGEITSLESIKDEILITADNVTKVTNFADVYLGANDSNPTTRTDGSALQEGDVYFNTSLNEFRVFTGSEFLAFPPDTTNNIFIERFSGDNAQTDFNLSINPTNKDFVQIYIDGVYQQKNTFSLSNSIISFSEAPPLGTENIEIVVLYSVDIGATDANLVSVEDVNNYYLGDKVEEVLQEVGASLETKVTESEARNALSASGDLSYDSATGTFSVTTYKSSDFDSDFGGKSTDDLSEGISNLYYTDVRANSAIDSRVTKTFVEGLGVDFTSLSNKPDPTVTLAGDLSGSVTLTDLGNGTLTATVADDSHNHVISNVDGLQNSLDNKIETSEIGVSVQAFDADTAKTDAAQTFTAEQTFNQNIVMANGKGIDFSATSSSGASELFDDYEEGRFSPFFFDDSNGQFAGAVADSGYYVKIGKVVHCAGVVNWTSKPSSGGTLRVRNLPFAAANPGSPTAPNSDFSNTFGDGIQIRVSVTDFIFYDNGSLQGNNLINFMDSSGTFRFNVTYFV